jgi:hypothetical protein
MELVGRRVASRAELWGDRRADLRAGRRALRRVKSRWFSRDQALCVTPDSLVERIYAIQLHQIPRPLRQTDFPEESGRRLHLHPPDATRLFRRYSHPGYFRKALRGRSHLLAPR